MYLSLIPVIGRYKVTQGWHKWHKAIDIDCGVGTPVYNVLNGWVEEVSERPDMGLTLIIVDNITGYTALYAHLQEVNVREDQYVSQKVLVAKSGNTGSKTTGAHLHYTYFDRDYNSPLELFYPEDSQVRYVNRTKL